MSNETYSLYIVDTQDLTKEFVESFSDETDAHRHKVELQTELDEDADSEGLCAIVLKE